LVKFSINEERGNFMARCFICNNEASVTAYQTWDYAIQCQNCGQYILTDNAKDRLQEENSKKLSIILRERKLKEKKSIAIFASKPTTDIEHIHFPIITIDELLNSFPTSILERIDRTLENLVAMSEHPGSKIRVLNDDFSIFFTESSTSGEVFFLMRQLFEDGYITGNVQTIPTEITVTAKGWNRIAELEREKVTESSKAFVAMWFNDDVENAYETAIKKAVVDAGYEPVRIDKVEHNNKIDDEIIANIRESKFVIADFTGHRGGVYFEAGYAMGLGKPVIWTCREDHLKDIHFDTRQYAHIVWDTEEDLYQKLYNRIRATI
jgi:nucleoside 2-deoxyribosyltransferase/ribosomal protein S27E